MQVFISYAAEDRERAEQVYLALIGAGYQSFFDRDSLPPAGDFHARIKKAVDESDVFVFLVSPNSIAVGSYALTELKYARAKWAHPKGRVVPVILSRVAWKSIPNYLTAVTVLEPEGNVAAEVVDAVSGLRKEIEIGLRRRDRTRAANQTWMRNAFSSRVQARRFFGQPLAPLDSSGLSGAPRNEPAGQLRPAFCGAPIDAVYVVIGGEGVGKSWLVAQTWCSSDPQPLLVVFTADELKDPSALRDLEDVIIEKLLAQTGAPLSDIARKRWHRRFKGWHDKPAPDNVRITVFVDGLDQFPAFRWPQWIDAAADFLMSIGGQLVVTTRAVHFTERLQTAVTSKVRRIIVEEWSTDELQTLLLGRGIDPDRLSPVVFDSLRNPRMLGIAVELLDARDIEGFEQLSVGRLLFEHLRRAERDGTARLSPQHFAKTLQLLADRILARVSAEQRDDLKLFDTSLDERLRAVSTSRFFSTVPGDPDFYEIKDDGLALALGLWLVDALRVEHRNRRDPASNLAVILEPVLALDRTSDVLSAAVLVACLWENVPLEVAAALIRHFVALQNLLDSEREAFGALAKRAPQAFMMAAHDAALYAGHIPNLAWLTDALALARLDAAVWATMAKHIAHWLSYYSLAPERRMFADPASEPKEKVEAERTKRQSDLDGLVASMSPAETAFMETRLSRRDEGELSDLHRLAFHLLAGRALETFADSLMNWSFANALNPSLQSPDREFQLLVRFDAADWRRTRDELRRQSRMFRAQGTSRTGEWALVGVLRATGDLDDAAHAEEIAERLTSDHEKRRPWRLVATYCETDPCDPASPEPGNVGRTAEKFAALAPSRLHMSTGRTLQDSLFSMGRAGLARFKPATAIAVHRKFAADVANRDGFPRRQGIIALLPHSAVLEDSTVDRLIAAAGASTAKRADGTEQDRDEWLTTQYSLFVTLPHKTGNEQLAILSQLHSSTLLMSLLSTLKPAQARRLEGVLERIRQPGKAVALRNVLTFAHYSGTPLSQRAKVILANLLSSPDWMIRMNVLGITTRTGDQTLVDAFVASGWDANALDPDKDRFEIWHGSSVLLTAVEARKVGIDSALERIGLGFCGFAAARLGKDAAENVARRIDRALKKALEFTTCPQLPQLEQLTSTGSDVMPPMLSLAEDDRPLGPDEFFESASESPQDFEARQERVWQAFRRYSRELTVAEARLLLTDLSFSGVRAIVSASPPLAQTWKSALANSGEQQLASLNTFSLQLAAALADTDAAGAATLLRRALNVVPTIRHVIGPARIPVGAYAAWSTVRVPEIRRLCFERLDRAPNDERLATEVLAAWTAGMKAPIEDYVREKLASEVPAQICRALMVAGFSDTTIQADATLNLYRDTKGFIGSACQAARYAYERNGWARHWYTRMRAANDPQEFWRCSVLLTKLVDGRYALWRRPGDPASPTFDTFFPTIESQIDQRIKRWRDQRRETLFGEKVPDPIFLGDS